MRRIPLLLPALALAAPLQAQAPSTSSATDPEAELLALLNTPVTVASRKAMTTRESPGVITLLSREEIQASGARDLIDLLRLVPGFEIGYDVQGVTGPAMRGLWGYEGKILVLWDGVEMNESLYGTVALGNRFPIDQIRRVEIIRGPGSSIYGGYAEVAVIQITSLGAEDLKGLGAGITYGRGKDAAYRQTAQVVGALGGDEVTVTFGGFGGTGVRSDGTYIDPSGTPVNLKDDSRIRPLFAHLGVKAGGFQGRVIVDQYALEQRDNLGNATPSPTGIRFGSTNVDLRYAWSLSRDVVLTPFLTWRDQKPWWVDDPTAGTFLYTATRTRGGLGLAWDLNTDMNLAAGAEVQKDAAEARPPTASAFPGGAATVSYTSKALYGQVQYQGPVNLTLGARWEDHSEVGSAFVPRAALTKALGKWHVKLLYAHAFRTPAIMNINQSLDPTRPIEPEKTRTAEVEVGVQTGPSLITLNVFDTKIDKPLVYTQIAAATGYLNQARTGSRGFELEWKLRRPWGFLNAAYSQHEARNEVSFWAVPGHDKNFLGFAPQKVSASAGLRLTSAWTLGGSAVWLGERYAYAWDPSAGSIQLTQAPADLLMGVNLSFTAQGFTAALGLQDALDRRSPYHQPYDGGHGPLPGPGREITAKLRYGF